MGWLGKGGWFSEKGGSGREKGGCIRTRVVG